MQTINFFILPIKSFENLESKILKLKEVSDIIKVNFDNISLSSDFMSPDSNGKTIFENMAINSTTMFLFQFLGKGKSLSDDIDMFDYHNQLITLNDSDSITDKYLVKNKEDLIICYQKNAYCLLDFSELFEWKRKCFPELLFSEDSFGNNNKGFGTNFQKDVFEKLYKQTVDCLIALNNQTNELIRLDVSNRISTLQTSLSNIECSGKGSNEDREYKKKVYTIKEVNGEKTQVECEIICTPHFKLIRRDSNFRIYFSWGNDKIQAQKFIIVKVGSHWNDKMDSTLSEIKITYS